jgi:8-oxo-dGTP pyrophosphatase MutT (NUDIX family)
MDAGIISSDIVASDQLESSPGWAGRLGNLMILERFIEARHQARSQYCPSLSYGRHFAPPGPSARSAAVMILIQQPHAKADWRDCSLPLTVRPPFLADHPGQISLPGGRLEHGENYQQAAEREFCEELGVPKFPGRVLGSLSPMWVFNSDYYLTPFLAVHCGSLEYYPCHREVARVIHLPVSELLKQNQPKFNRFSRGSVHWNAGAFHSGEDCIWGATAMILAELAALLRLLDESI